MFDNHTLTSFRSLVETSQNIVVLTHFNPDGDAIGSALSWFHTLNSLGKKVKVLVPNDFPQNLKFLEGASDIIIYRNSKDLAEKALDEADLLISTDFKDLTRIEALEHVVRACKAKKVVIDHHLNPTESDFDLTFSHIPSSSTCEISYVLFCLLGWKKHVSLVAAEGIYAGIVTDTGSFSFACRRKETFDTVSELIEIGVDVCRIHREIYDTFSEDRLRLLGHCLSNRLKVIPQHKTAYMYLTKEDLDRFNYVAGDTEGVVNYALSMAQVEFAAFFTQRDNRVRISLRSKGEVDTNAFAACYYKGGGHHNASGGSSFLSMEETLREFEAIVPDWMEKQQLGTPKA